jgi:hypothetical protein
LMVDKTKSIWRKVTSLRTASERLRDISQKVIWEKQRTSTFSYHRRVKRAEFDPCSFEAVVNGQMGLYTMSNES